jgi:hypothetical protein
MNNRLFAVAILLLLLHAEPAARTTSVAAGRASWS